MTTTNFEVIRTKVKVKKQINYNKRGMMALYSPFVNNIMLLISLIHIGLRQLYWPEDVGQRPIQLPEAQ